MFPLRDRETPSNNRNRPINSRAFERTRNDSNYQNNRRIYDNRRHRTLQDYLNDRHNRSYQLHNDKRESNELMRERKKLQNATDENLKLKRKLEEISKEKEYDKKKQSQRFCVYGESSSSSESDGGGAPIYGKKRKTDITSSNQDHSSLFNDNNQYKFQKNMCSSQPQIYTHIFPETVRTNPPGYDLRQKPKPKPKVFLDASLLQQNVEYEFPYKQPTEKKPGLFRLEEVPYDHNNGASVALKDWGRPSEDDFTAIDIIQKNTYYQSSASKKAEVLRFRIKNTSNIKDKIKYYIELTNIETERVKELQEAKSISNRLNTTESKLGIIYEGIHDCGDNAELRLHEINVLTDSKGSNSDEVTNKWKEITKKFPYDINMWRNHLKYNRDNLIPSSFIKDSIIPCLASLSSILNHKSLSMQEGTEDYIVDLIVGAATLYIEMGSSYKAIGIIQALLEFYFLVPQRVKNFNFKKKIAAFKCYWETPIPKVGHVNAQGWNRVVSNVTYNKYDFPQNNLITEKDEEETQNLLAKDKKEINYEVWQPTYNANSNSKLFKHYNSFDDIKLFLLKLPQEIILKAVYKILIKLGACLPNLKDISQESIFQECNVSFYEHNFKMKYYGMEKFIDNIFYHLSGVEGEMYLYETVARMMTSKAYVLKNYNNYEEAKLEFINEARSIIDKCIRAPNDSEMAIFKSYEAQLHFEIFLHFHEKNISTLLPNLDNTYVLVNIFDPDIPSPHLLAALKYFISVCRALPHYDETKENSKLQFLIKITFPNEKEMDYQSKEVQERAMKQWENAMLHETDFNLPSGTRWIGDIKSFALELFSTLCYEVEEDPTKKFEVFDQFYSTTILKDNEDLAEAYFKTWNYHLNYYCGKKTSFMNRLKEFVVNIFPRNINLTQMYVEHLHHNKFETRCFFLLNESDDDVVKVLRCAIKLNTELDHIRTQKVLTSVKPNYKYFYDRLKDAAKTCSNGIIPESFLWRCCLFFIKHAKKHRIQ